jgi:hypothetical protein
MRLKALGSLGTLLGIAGLTVFGHVPAPNSPLTTEVITPRHHGPMVRVGVPGVDGTASSSNWSGYAVTGSAFTYAKGSWHVPGVDCAKTPGTFSSHWVGIDGYADKTVEQIGTDSDCSGGTPTYYAWYEFYPAGSVLISTVPVGDGDIISAEVSYNGSQFKVTLTDETTGKSFSKSKTVSGAKRTSAEWISEAPSSGSTILPLADFVKSNFGFDKTAIKNTNYASDSSITGPISDFGSTVEEITMVNGSTKKAVPSALTTDGSSFDVVWKHE